MGLLKKITKPISKILDKIIPNEIKPALPFVSAMAPFMLPAGIAGGTGLGAILRRAALTGGLNIGSQLAQEGSEGDFSGLSALMAAGTGAMTAPGATDYFGAQKELASEGSGILSKAKEFGFSGLEKGAEFFEPATEMFGATEGTLAPGFDKATLKALAVPTAQGMGDLAMADARRALRDYERQLEETGDIGSDENRALAIRLAMEAGGHSEETIVETIKSLGYKQGGRVGLREGGGAYQAYQQILPPAKLEIARPSHHFSPFIEQAQAVFPRLNKLEQGVDRAEGSLNRIRDRLGDDQRQLGLLGNYTPGLAQPLPASPMHSFGLLAQLPTGLNRGVDLQSQQMADGGILEIEFKEMADGGMTDSVLPRGTEMDYRGGGMIPMGSKERADDVPARLSKNEFVMTADAVRAAGGGSVNVGAKRMYDLMHNLEARV